MKIVTTVTLHKTGHPIRNTFWKVRPALSHLRFLIGLRRMGAKISIRVAVTHTPPQRAWAWCVRTARLAWSRKDPRYAVVAYDVHRYCADMIEGGRWFNTYTLEETRRCWRKSSIPALMEEMEEEFAYTGRRYLTLGGEDCDVRYLNRFEANPSFIDTYRPYE
jgi:hypothetical protein